MSVTVVPTNDQVIQMNLDRLISIFSLPPEYYVSIICGNKHGAPTSLWNTDYYIHIGKNPKSVSVSNGDAGIFRKETFKTGTRYQRVAFMRINPYEPLHSCIELNGNVSENQLITLKLTEASIDWLFERGCVKEIELFAIVLPESETDCFNVF